MDNTTQAEKPATFTPGPWETREWAYYTDIINSHNAGLITSIQDEPGDKGEMRANARLIAASPDLLEACKAMVDFVALAAHEHGGKPGWEGVLQACEQGEDAIAKAEGGAG